MDQTKDGGGGTKKSETKNLVDFKSDMHRQIQHTQRKLYTKMFYCYTLIICTQIFNMKISLI